MLCFFAPTLSFYNVLRPGLQSLVENSGDQTRLVHFFKDFLIFIRGASFILTATRLGKSVCRCFTALRVQVVRIWYHVLSEQNIPQCISDLNVYSMCIIDDNIKELRHETLILRWSVFSFIISLLIQFQYCVVNGFNSISKFIYFFSFTSKCSWKYFFKPLNFKNACW